MVLSMLQHNVADPILVGRPASFERRCAGSIQRTTELISLRRNQCTTRQGSGAGVRMANGDWAFVCGGMYSRRLAASSLTGVASVATCARDHEVQERNVSAISIATTWCMVSLLLGKRA